VEVSLAKLRPETKLANRRFYKERLLAKTGMAGMTRIQDGMRLEALAGTRYRRRICTVLTEQG